MKDQERRGGTTKEGKRFPGSLQGGEMSKERAEDITTQKRRSGT